ncbi:MAG: TadE/TadG family type IV pilus assembly protein [Pseudomonadota bacterium]
MQKLLKSRRRHFLRDDEGATAIEFAFLAMPFFLTMFAILETSLSYTAQQVISNATANISREIRTGRMDPAALGQSAFRTRFCQEIEIMVPDSCPDLHIDISQYATFSAVPNQVPDLSDPSNFQFDPGGRGTINQMRIVYEWPIITDLMKKHMSPYDNGKALLYSTTTWRNE